MRPVVLVLLATFALLGLSYWALRSGDRQTLAPGPDVRAESFMQNVLLRRGGPAREYLTRAAAKRVSADSLAAIGAAFQQLRPGRDAEATIETIDSRQSVVRVEILFEDGSTTQLQLPLTWERGLWRISNLEPLEMVLSARAAELQSESR